MLQFKQELYCQLYISNLKENKGTFSQINDLKEIVVELIEKAQTTKEIKNPSSPQIIYNVLEHICFWLWNPMVLTSNRRCPFRIYSIIKSYSYCIKNYKKCW